MKAVDVTGRQDILSMALHQAEQESKEITEALNAIREKEYLLKGTYGAFMKDKEQLKHSRYFYEASLGKINETIESINSWKTQLNELSEESNLTC